MPRVRLVLAIHDHQPVGNLDFVFERTVRDCYEPTIAWLERHAGLRCAFHVSGPLWDWLANHDAGLLERFAALVRRGQVEPLGGGLQEPMLAILPERDAKAQVVAMADRVEGLTGRRPRGIWLTERVWEPDLPRLLAAAGAEYTLVDDTHFRQAGLVGDVSKGYRVTDRAGDAVAVFPIDARLRYLLPFAPVDELMAYLRSLDPGPGEPPVVVTYGDDGEKFGSWPGTREWVWEGGWLEAFAEAVESAADWLELAHPSEVLDDTAPAGRIYLPTTSYEEMGEWSLPGEATPLYLDLRARMEASATWAADRPFLRGGIWQGFLTKYPEANRLYRYMLATSDAVDAMPKGAAKDEATALLWQGQCNCAYWHGLFGGVYLHHLRTALWSCLLRATALASSRGARAAEVRAADIVGDRRRGFTLHSADLDVWIDPRSGGSVTLLGHLATGTNLTDVLTRHAEGYHALVGRGAEEPEGNAGGPKDDAERPPSIHHVAGTGGTELLAHLGSDAVERTSFLDRLTLDGGQVVDLSGEAYEAEALEDGVRLTVAAELSDGCTLEITKEIRVRGAALLVRWSLDAAGPADGTPIRFEPELNLAWFGEARADRPGGTRLDWSPDLDVDMAWTPSGELRREALQTVSRSESGFELTPQGTTLTLGFDLCPAPGRPAEVEVSLDVLASSP